MTPVSEKRERHVVLITLDVLIKLRESHLTDNNAGRDERIRFYIIFHDTLFRQDAIEYYYK